MTKKTPVISNIVDLNEHSTDEWRKLNSALNDQLFEVRSHGRAVEDALAAERLKVELLKVKLEKANDELLAVEVHVNLVARELEALKAEHAKAGE